MSAFGKSQPPPQGYDTGRAYQESSYSFPAPQYVPQSSLPSSTAAPGYQHANQMTAMDYGSHQARSAYDDHSGPYLNVGSTPIPEVTSYAPLRGNGGSKIYVQITALYELMTTSLPSFSLVFGQRKCPASLTKMVHQQGAACQYTVTAEVPQFATTGSPSSHVGVYMLLETGDELIGRVDVGQFTYVEDENLSGSNTPLDSTRKRKISTESGELLRSPAKRISSQNLRQKEEYNAYAYADAASYSPYLTPNPPYPGLIPQYGRSPSGFPPVQPSNQIAYGYSNSSTSSGPTVKAETASSHWNSAYPRFNSNVTRSPGVPSNTTVNRPTLSALPPTGTANPPLIRTTCLQQTPSPATTPHGNVGQHYNTYSLYPHKAKLDLKGELKSMRDNWSEDEWKSKRRLVHFKRSQSGSTITATFQPISLDDRPQNSVCISCIYWEERRNYFVTSVDTIYLLEQLVAARFTVEEKNRIRRNLEGFKPLTVSKGKPDSEEFFKVIMGFPTPKPRNIEKDVKVFHWDDLSSALKKIISKYSASPASTMPPVPGLLTPISSTGYTTEGSSTGISYSSDHHGAVSPRSISGSNSSVAYNSNVPTRVLSPHDQKPMLLQSGPPDLRLSLPHSHESTSQWQASHHHMGNPQSQYQQFGGQNARGSWDISSYLENSPATAAGTSSGSQSLNYAAQNSRGLSDASGNADENRNMGTLSSQRESHQTPRT